ncbi:MAG TPA: hypothetical protein VFW94_24420 [Candidatus Acidoferrales bacterium]|nr:hypothetical protein [Candidatus Acidoferrales bacterium]
MATTPSPMSGQSQGAPAQGGGAPGGQPSAQQAPSQGQASDLQQLLANWFQVAKQMASADPRLASGAEKVAQGVQEMQTALVTPPQHTPLGQQPSY